MITGIIVALKDETVTLTKQKIGKGQGLQIKENIWVACSGAGQNNARTCAEQLVNQGCSRLISWGCAAGLSDSVKPGDLVIASNMAEPVTDQQGKNLAWPNYCLRVLQQESKGTLPVRIGLITTSDTMVATSQDKRQLHGTTGAHALDMESAAIARVAKRHGIDFLAIRAIADPVAMDLPETVKQALTPEGEVSLKLLFTNLAIRPWDLPNLIRLGLHFQKAKRTLTKTAVHLEVMTGFNQVTQ